MGPFAKPYCEYSTGGNLMVFNKDHDTREKLIANSFKSFKSKVLTAKHRRSLQLLCTVGGNQARLDARSEFEISGNRLGWPGESNSSEDVRFLFSPLTTPPLWPPKREYNAVSAIADEI